MASNLPPAAQAATVDKSTPADSINFTGTWMREISLQLTALTAAHNALLAKLDTANVAGGGNVAACQVLLVNVLPENRPAGY